MIRRQFDNSYMCGHYPIEAMAAFFNDRELPEKLDLNKYTHITNVKLFVSSHLNALRVYDKNKMVFELYRDLLLLKQLILEKEKW